METILRVDNMILDFIQAHIRNPILDTIMPIITSLGNGSILWIAIGIFLIANKNYRKYGYMIIISLCLCLIIGNLGLKPLVARARPFNANNALDLLLISPPKDFSFPSGHTMTSFAAATVIFYMNKKFGVLAIILSILIAFSRLYLYVHYPSDVFVGMLSGIIIGFISIKMYCFYSRKKSI